MVTRRIDVYNNYEGATCLVQYIGSANDLVLLSAIGRISTVAFRDMGTGMIRSTPNSVLRDVTGTTLLVSVFLAAPVIQQCDKNGLCSWVIFHGLSAGHQIVASVELIA